MLQRDLFSEFVEPQSVFDGETINPVLDTPRLSGQMQRVFELMSDSKWRTLGEIQAIVGGSEAGCSARLRDCRKARWGSHTVNRRRREPAEAGLFEYSLILRGK